MDLFPHFPGSYQRVLQDSALTHKGKSSPEDEGHRVQYPSQCSPRFRLHRKLCHPADENKNPFLGLTSSSQEEVTRTTAVAGEGRAAKAMTSIRPCKEQVQ